MRLITKMALLFYTAMVLLFVVISAGLALNVIPMDYFGWFIEIIYEDPQLRMVVGLVSVLVFLVNILFNQAISGKEFREQNIAFDNPAGRVTVSLNAMEDLIRRVVCRLNEVKDVRGVRIKASKRGLEVRVNLALHSDVSIPEISAQLQDIVKKKILDTIGLEESVVVRVDITKIFLDQKSTLHKDNEIKTSVDTLQSTVPFQGYRA